MNNDTEQVGIQCSICREIYYNLNGNVQIQKNTADGNYYCMDCAINNDTERIRKEGDEMSTKNTKPEINESDVVAEKTLTITVRRMKDGTATVTTNASDDLKMHEAIGLLEDVKHNLLNRK